MSDIPKQYQGCHTSIYAVCRDFERIGEEDPVQAFREIAAFRTWMRGEVGSQTFDAKARIARDAYSGQWGDKQALAEHLGISRSHLDDLLTRAAQLDIPTL